MRREIGIASLVLLVGGGALGVLQACVDGTTPDCTSADAQCGPDGAPEDVAVPTDAKTDATDATADAGDASADANADASVPDASDASDASDATSE